MFLIYCMLLKGLGAKKVKDKKSDLWWLVQAQLHEVKS